MTATVDDDSALMRRVQEGDEGAFEVLVDRHRQAVLNFVQRTLQDPDESEDVAQQTFVQAWKAAGRYRATAKFTTWLYTIARNLCLNELRRRSRHPAESMESPVETEDGPLRRDYQDTRGPGVEEQVLLGELAGRIEAAVALLPENQRSALLLFRDEEMAYEDIAEVLGVTVSATKSLIHRARETLKFRLKPYLRTGQWPVAPESGGAATFPGNRF